MRINTPLDANPKPKKYMDPPGHISKYLGFNYDSVEHLCWNYQKFQTRQNPLEHVGNDQCKFFRMLNPKLFVVPHNDPAYAMYLPDVESQSVPVSAKPELLPPKNGIRIAKTFAKKQYFGTATKNVGGKFCYDVQYDDGDFEHFDIDEFTLHSEQFRNTPLTPSKQIESEVFSVVINNTKITKIINLKVVCEHNVAYAALECVVTRHGGELSDPQWFQLGALIKSNTDAEIREHNWTEICSYLNETEIDCELKSLFHVVTVNPKSSRVKRRTARQSMLAAYVETDNKNTVSCILPDGTHFSFAETELDSVIIHANIARARVPSTSTNSTDTKSEPVPINTFIQHDGSPVVKTTYCPQSYPEVLKTVNSEMWRNAIENCVAELRSMEVGYFKKLKNLPHDSKPITSRFVNQVKMQHEHQKWFAFTRWTPRGFQQEPDSASGDFDGHYDPDNVFAGTPSLALLRFLMAKKCLKRWKSFHFDFKRAFSSTVLERTINVLMPKGYVLRDEDGDELYLELTHSCEGLKQSGANWLSKVTKFLLDYGFEQSITEPKLFTKNLPNNGRCEFMLYIDDILGITNSSSFVKQFFNDLNAFSRCKDQGEIVSTLGIELEHTPVSVSLSQQTQIEKLLYRHDMVDCNGRDVPIPSTFRLPEALDNVPLNAHQKQIFQSLVGSFLYIARNTRPDIGHATWILACAMSQPTEPCLKAAFHLLRYLKQTKQLKLTYKFSSSSELTPELLNEGVDVNFRVPHGFCDANWAAPRSVSFTLVMWMNAALLWRVHRQSSPALSTVESELSALSEQAREMEYATKIFTDLALNIEQALPIHCDNRGAIENAKHPILKDNLKHVAIREFYVRGSIDRGTVTVHKIRGTINPADVGTKLLALSMFRKYCDYLLNVSGRKVTVYVKPERKTK